MTIRKQTSRKGFTLIELLTVIAIIGILASILIPTIGNVITTAKKASAQNNAGQIAKSYLAFSTNGSNSRNIASTLENGGGRDANVAKKVEDAAYILAKGAQLNEASVWFIKSDEALSGASMPKVVISGDMNSATDVDPSFASCNPKSWAFVAGLSSNAPPTSTPLLWTYGLQTTGIWDTNSPWKAGGHIAYMDGHVEWADKLDKNGTCFTGYATQGNGVAGTAQVDYTKAISAKAIVLNKDGKGD